MTADPTAPIVPPEKQRQYTKGAARRANIIAEAEKLFAEVGYNQPTMIDIAARCGISRGGLLRYFPTKESLLIAVLNRRGMVSEPPGKRTESASPVYDRTPDLERFWEKRGRDVEFRLDLRVADGDLGGALHELMKDNAADRGYLALFVTLSAEATNPEHPAHDLFANTYAATTAWVTRHVEEFISAEHRYRTAKGKAAAVTGLTASIIAVMDGLQTQALYDPQLDIVGAFDTFLVSVGLLDREPD